MKIGVTFPQLEIGNDPVIIRDYAQLADSLGLNHILAYDHVLGANPDRPGGWRGPYTYQSSFHEPFILFSYLAGLTQRIEFVTGIIILPQRETALVAKQVATLDMVSNGRFRFGVGIGWNKVEYVALNQNFHRRGRRLEEQITVLRQLWQQDLVVYKGEWHTIDDAGINPRPQRHIPLWFGGHADPVLRRIAQMGDGWFPQYRHPNHAQKKLAILDKYLAENGRSRADIGIEARLSYGEGDPNVWQQTIDAWRTAGASHIALNTMGLGFQTPQQHLKAIEHFANTILP